MKLQIVDRKSNSKQSVSLPTQFSEEIRPDLIKRAFHYYQSKKRQPYGATPRAGMNVSARISKRRRDYRTSYGIGISRVPRKIVSRRGRRMNWIGALAPGTVGGRRAHPPKAEKIWEQKLNRKERRKAIRSAMAATLSKEVVEAKHRVPDNYPVVLDGEFESISKTTEARDAFIALGLKNELSRVEEKKVRAGKGKGRGRKYRRKVGPLVVVSTACDLQNSARNIPGVDVVAVSELNAADLAPGAEPGRLTYFTAPAVKAIEEQKLFSHPVRRSFAAAKVSAEDIQKKSTKGDEA